MLFYELTEICFDILYPEIQIAQFLVGIILAQILAQMLVDHRANVIAFQMDQG